MKKKRWNRKEKGRGEGIRRGVEERQNEEWKDEKEEVGRRNKKRWRRSKKKKTSRNRIRMKKRRVEGRIKGG